MTFYDCDGAPVAYTEDNETIYLFTGEPVAYFYENAVYSFSGVHLGWFENGWIRDLHGSCVFFSEDSTGGPLKPLKQLKPLKSLKQLKPLRSLRELKHLKALNRLSWSQKSGRAFFRG